jgi:hypothetical protein
MRRRPGTLAAGMNTDSPLQSALAEIRAFWSEAPLAGASEDEIRRVASGLSIELSQDMVEYLTTAVPLDDVIMRTDGNPLRLWGIGGLGRHQDGYSYNPMLQEDIDDWDRNLMVVADEGADPYVVPLSGSQDHPPRVSMAPHGAGEWRFGPVCSLPAFLVLSTAKHRQLEMGDATGDYEAAEAFWQEVAQRWEDGG